MRSLFAAAIAALLLSAELRAADTTRVLFIGNSYTASNDLPGTVASLAASSGDVVLTAAHAPGGATLFSHVSNPITLSLLDSGVWDYVVLQEQSQRPALPDADVESDFYPHARYLAQRARAVNPCTRVMFYNTWGYQSGDPAGCSFFAPLCSYTGMDSLLRLRYGNVADSCDAYIAPAGPVWRRLRATSGINLYDADGQHPSRAGTYGAACAIYTIILGKSPTSATFDGTLASTDAIAIRTAADVVAFDSLGYWGQHYRAPAPVVEFLTAITGLKVAFLNSTLDAEGYEWSFGDGGTDTTASPVHTYASGGTYTVRLIARHVCGGTDTLEKTITLTTVGIAEGDVLSEATIGPNPVKEVLYLHHLPADARLWLIDMRGRVVRQSGVSGGKATLETGTLPRGVYVVKAEVRGASRLWKVIVE